MKTIWMPLANADNNCGTGAGGFKSGNTCGGGTRSVKLSTPPSKALGKIKYRATDSTEAEYYQFFAAHGNPHEVSHGHSEIAEALASQGRSKVVLRDFTTPGYPIAGAVSFDATDKDVSIDHLGSTGVIKGVGAELVRYVVERAAAAKKGISFESTPNAEKFYAAMGFKHTDASQSKLMGATAEEVAAMKKALGSSGRNTK